MDQYILKILEYTVKAPSGHNTQPWKFKTGPDFIRIYPDYSRRLPVVDFDDHALFISLGCALENLLIAAHHFCYETKVEYNLQEGEKEHIHIGLGKGNPAKNEILFEAIDKRQSTKNTYDGKAIPQEHILKLKEAANQDGVILNFIHEQSQFEQVVELIKEANVRQFSNRDFKNELFSWIRFNEKLAQATKDGIRSATMGSPSVPTWLGRLIFRFFVSPNSEAAKCAGLVKSSSALVLFTAVKNDKETWIKLGQSFERVALTSASLGIHHAHVNMPCEELPVRNKLKRLFGFTIEEPLLLIRLGYSARMPGAYRRPVSEVVEGSGGLEG